MFTDLSGAHMRNVNLSADTDGRKTDLRAASLYWSDLTGAEIGNASFVDADLRKAYLCGTDLRQADLTRADLREAVLDEDPQDPESDCTPAKLPESSKFPEACWPDEIHEVASCGAEARKIVCQRDGQVAQDPKVPECRQPQEGP
ncbi:hypothetical protein GCM10027562_28990 [Arthrobacter pigmenti]